MITCQSEGWLRQSGNPQDVFFFPPFLVCFPSRLFCQHLLCQAHISVAILELLRYFHPILGYSSCRRCRCWQRKVHLFSVDLGSNYKLAFGKWQAKSGRKLPFRLENCSWPLAVRCIAPAFDILTPSVVL